MKRIVTASDTMVESGAGALPKGSDVDNKSLFLNREL